MSMSTGSDAATRTAEAVDPGWATIGGTSVFHRRAALLQAAATLQRSAAHRTANRHIARQLRSRADYNLRMAGEATSNAYWPSDIDGQEGSLA